MDELWYQKLGFHSNPFSIKPAAFSDEVIGYNLEAVYDKVNAGSILHIVGDYGTGKTTLMKQIIRKFGGRRQVVHVTRNTSEEALNAEKILRGKYGLFEKFVKRLPDNMIMLIDEASELTNEDSEELLKYYKKANIKSIVLFSKELVKDKFVPDFKEILDGNIINLSELSEDHAVAIVRKRIGNSAILPDEILKKIFASSRKNPRELLENCEDVCRIAVGLGARQAADEHLRKLFGNRFDKPPEIRIKELVVPESELAAVPRPGADEDMPNVVLRLERPETAPKARVRKAKSGKSGTSGKKKVSLRKKSVPKYKKQNVRNEIKAEMADEDPEYLT